MEMDAREFAAWKFAWYEALTIGVEAREFRVAAFLLQRCGTSGQINPSQALVAHSLACSISTVERAITSLITAGALQRVRQSRAMSNHYRFVDAWKDQQLVLQKTRRRQWQELRRTDPAELKGPEHSNQT